MGYRTFFGLAKEPFCADLELGDILQTENLSGVYKRMCYAIRLGAISLVTGEVGAGKSTALRWSADRFHPSKYKVLWVTASSGSVLEVYRQILSELNVQTASTSRAMLIGSIKEQVVDLVRSKKLQPVLIIDEASLLRLDVYAELHTLTQFNGDSKPWLPIILAGQNNLADNLLHRTAIPLSSRIVARSHMMATKREDLEKYIGHHLKIAGLKHSPFDDAAVTAVHQGSGGIFRKANHLARGALVAAAAEKSQSVTAEHVRLASTELFL